jgi:uncharacterized protein (DUF4415 family)
VVMQSELPVTKEEEELWNEIEKKVGRPRKEDRLVITSIRLPRNVVEYFSSRGGRKQMRDILSAYVDESNKLNEVK